MNPDFLLEFQNLPSLQSAKNQKYYFGTNLGFEFFVFVSYI